MAWIQKIDLANSLVYRPARADVPHRPNTCDDFDDPPTIQPLYRRYFIIIAAGDGVVLV